MPRAMFRLSHPGSPGLPGGSTAEVRDSCAGQAPPTPSWSSYSPRTDQGRICFLRHVQLSSDSPRLPTPCTGLRPCTAPPPRHLARDPPPPAAVCPSQAPRGRRGRSAGRRAPAAVGAPCPRGAPLPCQRSCWPELLSSVGRGGHGSACWWMGGRHGPARTHPAPQAYAVPMCKSGLPWTRRGLSLQPGSAVEGWSCLILPHTSSASLQLSWGWSPTGWLPRC